jgi:hypothetical protein
MNAKKIRRRVMKGMVVRVDSRASNALADVLIGNGAAAVKRRIEVIRLVAAKVAYGGARFKYIVTDVGSKRTILLRADTKANAKELKKHRKYFQRFLKEKWEDDGQG